MFYKVVIETGHRRGESEFQIIRYLKSESSVQLFDMLEGELGLNADGVGYAITMVKSISREEYEEGRAEEKKNPLYLRAHVRFKINKKCTIKVVLQNRMDPLFIEGETIDISAGGVGIAYAGNILEKGTHLTISIDQLQVADKKAEIVWSFSRHGHVSAGLRWL